MVVEGRGISMQNNFNIGEAIRLREPDAKSAERGMTATADRDGAAGGESKMGSRFIKSEGISSSSEIKINTDIVHR